MWVLEEYPVTEFVVLPGHHLYKMDYQKLVESHRNNDARVTVAILSKRTSHHIIHDPGFGIVKLNLHNNQVIEHTDKAVSVSFSFFCNITPLVWIWYRHSVYGFSLQRRTFVTNVHTKKHFKRQNFFPTH